MMRRTAVGDHVDCWVEVRSGVYHHTVIQRPGEEWARMVHRTTRRPTHRGEMQRPVDRTGGEGTR